MFHVIFDRYYKLRSWALRQEIQCDAEDKDKNNKAHNNSPSVFVDCGRVDQGLVSQHVV